MKKNFYIFRAKQLLFTGSVLLCSLLFVLQSPLIIPALQESLLLLFRIVIPSLFPFFVVSSLLASGGFIRFLARLLTPVMAPLFRVNGAGALPFAMGVLSGYPTGAKVTVELYENHAITREEAMRLLPFTNNSGPLFIIGAVGTGMLHNQNLGIYLYVVHIISALLVGICFRFYASGSVTVASGHSVSAKPIGLAEAMSAAIHTILMVCGFILFFSALSACLSPLFDKLPAGMGLFCNAIPEVTAGAQRIVEAGFSLRLTLTFLSALTGFGGICVMMQVSGILSPANIPLKTYAFGKMLQGLFAGTITYCTFPSLFPEIETALLPATSSSPMEMPLFPTLFLSAVCLFFGIKLLLKTMDLV